MNEPNFSSARWRKSNTSGDTGCVEVAFADGWVGVRDTKDEGRGPILAFSGDAWRSFITAVKAHEFDLTA